MNVPILNVVHGLSPEAAQAAGELTRAIRDLTDKVRQLCGVSDAMLGLASKTSRQDTSVGEADGRIRHPAPADRPREAAAVEAPQPQFAPEPASSDVAVPQPASKPPVLADTPSEPFTPAATNLSAGWLANTKPKATGPNPAPKPVHVPIWSPERKAVLTREYPKGTPVPAIYEMLIALAGPAPSRDGVSVMAANMGLRRPGSEAPVRRVLPSIEPETTNFTTIANWSAARGIVFDGSNIDAVNKKRAALGFGPFVLERAPIGRRGQAA